MAKRIRINWKQEGVEKTFLEACVHEITVNGREGSSLKQASWKTVAENLKTQHNFIVEQRQMKNHYDFLKGKFAAWLKLKNKTGNVYDPVTNSFNLSEEEWQIEMKSNKYVEALRSAPLAFPELCCQLYEGSTSNGFDSWGPSSTLPHPSEEVNEHNLDGMNVECTQVDSPGKGVSEESSIRSQKKEKGEKRKHKATLESKLIEVGEDISKLAKMMIEKHTLSDDMDACLEKLETLGWDESDAKYETTLLLFGESADLRKLWVRLKPQNCEKWVKNAGAKYGLYLMDLDDEIIVIMIFCWYWVSLASRINVERIRDLNSALTGHEYTQELLHGTSTQCHEMMRLSRDAFILLCNHFKQKNWVQSSRSISLEEKLAMFFMVIGHNERFRMVKRRFQHSTETIHRCFHEVLKAMMNFAREVIVPTSSNVSTNNSERHRRLKEIFSGAIGALDGTLIHAIVPVDQQTRYRGRGKGECFQNVLAICDFDMIFTFVWAGWEGIAHDSRVLKEVAFNPNSGFPFPPPDKYYLCDAAYTNTRGFMTPYRGTRYWLADFRRQRALTKEERFNHAHAQLRNVIERAYGVLKARFPILKQMAPFSFPIQRDIVIACFAVHNFIRKCNIYDQLFMDYDENTMFHEMQSGENDGLLVQDIEWGSQGIDYMTSLRNQIANQLLSNESN
ncbi:putative Myb/SANT-like domain, harbinger transposase-derived nuclease domain-containing protein [Helianthus annuus]|nr:putative Myb/SANT-like domain, harbinger transposase-derived nuclease domain-containing protein [Helianthus annuus]